MNRKDRKDRTVYIMLTDYPDKVSRAIKRVGLWEYSHMSISTDEHYPKFFSFTGKRGFMTEDFDLHPTYKGTDVPCALFALPVTETELRNVERIIKHMTSNAEKYKYSYIGLAHANNVEQTERQLMEAVPRDRWSHTHHLLIWHGRRCCTARKPACERCPIVQCEYLNKPSNE